MIAAHDDWCERLAAAVSDGRFLEDPNFYRPHVDSCEHCRRIVSGLFALREHLERVGIEAPADLPETPDAKDVIDAALARHRALQKLRGGVVGLCLALALGVGGYFALRGGGPDARAPRDPVAYARSLHEAVFPRGDAPRTSLLLEDDARRAEYVAALDDPSSLVRRTALAALVFSGVPIDASRLEAILEHAREDLETPLEVASLAGDARYLADALEARRIATLRGVLTSAGVGASRGGPPVRASRLTPYLSHADAEVRKRALFALTFDGGFRPGPEVDALLDGDRDFDVRVAAALCLLDRRGEKGAEALIVRLREHADPALEELILPKLASHPAALALSTERVGDAATPVRLALAHALVVVRAGRAEPPTAVVERALADPDPDVWRLLADVAATAGWTQVRAPLQARWERAPRAERRILSATLVAWDVSSGDERRLETALAICEAERGEKLLLPHLRSISKGPFPSVAARAERLLADWTRR